MTTRTKTSLRQLSTGSLTKRFSLVCVFTVFLVVNLIGTSFYAQTTLFSKNSFIALKALNKTKNNSGQNITSISFDMEIVRPDYSSSKNPDTFDSYAVLDNLYVSTQRSSSRIAFSHETLIPTYSGTSNSRAPPALV